MVAFIDNEIALVHENTFPKVLQVLNCLDYYCKFKDGFSEIFLLIFGASQLIGILCIFTSIADWDGIFVFLYYLFVFLRLIINTFTLVNCLDNLNKNLLSLCKVLDRNYIENETRREEKCLNVLKGEILQIGPMKAMGFFSIDRSLLTSFSFFFTIPKNPLLIWV
jgi:hypothetical protein